MACLQISTRVFSLISKWVHQQGVHLLWYLDDWLVVAEFLPLLFHHRKLLLQLCQELSSVINWEKLDLEPSSCVQYLGMVIDTSWERLFPSDTHVLISGLVGQFSVASVSSSKDVAAAVMPHGMIGKVCSQELLSNAPSKMAPQRSLVANVG